MSETEGNSPATIFMVILQYIVIPFDSYLCYQTFHVLQCKAKYLAWLENELVDYSSHIHSNFKRHKMPHFSLLLCQ